MVWDSRDAIWTFAGRAEELETLLGMLAGQRSRGVVLAGSPGVGKTRLATEFLARAAGRPRIATGHITASRSTTPVPLGAVASLLPADAYPESQAESRARMLRIAAEALVRDVGDRRLVVLVDDAHLLDDTSATLIYQLVVSNAAFVVATVRSFERAPAAVVGLWKDDLLERMDVRELSTDA